MENITEYRKDVNRTMIINQLIEQNGYCSYLEIGVEWGNNFRSINCPFKIGVDPDPNSAATTFMTSDDFFAHIPDDQMFDIIFIDGLHEWHQCYRDIINSIRHLSPKGTIVCHDMGPLKEIITRIPPVTGEWTGNVYKALVEVQQTRNDVEVAMLYDVDYGTTIIRKQPMPETYFKDVVLESLTWEMWNERKIEFMGGMPWEVFKQNFLSNNYWNHKFSDVR